MSAAAFSIAGRPIGAGKAFLIAEVAQSHDGSLGLAHAFVDGAADAGADAVKFQTHIADAESTLDEQFRVKFSRQDATRYDYWKRMEFTPEQWAGLAAHAEERGIVFLSSPFSLAAVDLLQGIGMPAWKVGSGEVNSHDLLRAMAATGKPVLISSGMSAYSDLGGAVDVVRAAGAPVAVFQCTTKYPTPLAEVGLNVLDELRTRFSCPVGLSDHSGRPYPALAAMARGADLIEVHFVLDRAMFGPDVPVSLPPADLRLFADARDAFAEMDAHPVDNDAMAASLAPMRALFNKSLAPKAPLSKGAVLVADMLTTKKPGTGIPAHEIDKVVGRRLKKAVSPDRLLRRDDLE
ncbi:MAG: N-acetylneuraminate synthase [Alphaproteobacteria bacterium]|nr:N-acetylneuraminate synthase [Alphaproteobacteria bacterium]